MLLQLHYKYRLQGAHRACVCLIKRLSVDIQSSTFRCMQWYLSLLGFAAATLVPGLHRRFEALRLHSKRGINAPPSSSTHPVLLSLVLGID